MSIFSRCIFYVTSVFTNILAVILVLTYSVCGTCQTTEQTPKPTPSQTADFTAPNLPNILVVGDSLSSGYGIDPQQGWVSLLDKRLATQNFFYEVVNISTSGDTTTNGLEKLPDALKTYQPVIVIIALGANDGLRGIPTSVIEKNLDSLVEQSIASHAKVLLVGMLIPLNYGPNYRAEFENVYESVAKKYKLPLVPFLLKDIALNPDLMQSDSLHPNTAAQPIMLETVWQFLVPLLNS